MGRHGVFMIAGAVSGFAAVAIGAFGAHGISDPQARAWIDTGAKHHLAHTVMAFVCLSLRPSAGVGALWAAGAFLLGCLVFAGSLYAMALGAPRWFGAITPIGGAALLIGWAVLMGAGAGLIRSKSAAAAAGHTP
jgi:uncharacterized membrane protein YgdD (TMEM256/DUF423 family)